MPTTENITTTYAGESASKYVSAALLQNDSISNGAVSVRPNVKFKEVINTLDISGSMADGTCDFTDVGTVTLGERILEPKELQVNVKLCKQNYRDTWEAISMGYSAHDNLPPNFSEYLIGLMVAEVAQQNETSLWDGATGNSGEYDGLMVKLAANADQPAAMELDPTKATAITKANVESIFESVLDAVAVTNSAILGKPGFGLRISPTDFLFYAQAQATSGAFDAFYERGAQPTFLGYPLYVCPGIDVSEVVATYSDNLWFGTGLMSDYNEVRLIDTADTLGDQNVRFVMRFTGGTQFGIGADIATYGVNNTAN